MERDIIKIDDEKCNGCGLCVPNCHEGALQVIDGKVRLVSELMCDGLGACIGHCPEGAITIEKREAEPYDEIIVISDMVKKGSNTVIAHLSHLKDHHEYGYLEEGTTWLELHRDKLSFKVEEVLDAVNGKTLLLQASPGAPDAHGGHGTHGAHNANGAHGGHGAHGADTAGMALTVHTMPTVDTAGMALTGHTMPKEDTAGMALTVITAAAAPAAGSGSSPPHRFLTRTWR